MSDIDSGGTLDTSVAGGRKAQAKELIGQAGGALKTEAKTFASVAQDRVRAEAQKGTDKATRTLGDFANAIRKAGDELGAADQSPASRLVQQAADGLETFSRSLEGKDPGALLNDVRDFGRRHPMAFIGGAVLAGLALGRFVRASEHEPMAFGGEDMATAEEAMFDGPSEAELGVSGGLAAPVADNADAMEGPPPVVSAARPSLDDSVSDLTGAPETGSETGPAKGTDAGPNTTSPYLGGR